jgi:hypothetical protein
VPGALELESDVHSRGLPGFERSRRGCEEIGAVGGNGTGGTDAIAHRRGGRPCGPGARTLGDAPSRAAPQTQDQLGVTAALVEVCEPDWSDGVWWVWTDRLASSWLKSEMSNPLRILKALDANLNRQTELTLFGRAALALGFPDALSKFHLTKDVDAILSFEWLAAKDENLDFWVAQQKTNAELSSDELYLTHLFRESEIIIRPEWTEYRVGLRLELSKLDIYRPAVIDLILTKMARADDQDMQDIQFLLTKEQITRVSLEEAFKRARVPDVEEIRQLFLAAQPKVLQLALEFSK